MNPLTVAKGKLTKVGVGVAALGPILQNLLNVIGGDDVQTVVSAAEGTVGSVMVLAGALVALWGSLRAAVNYGGK
jgi:hypothetical protein